MGRPVVVDRQTNFGGGLNTTADESALGTDELRVATNVLLTEFGAATKRLGSQKLHATALGSPSPIRNGFLWQPGTGTPENLVVCNGVLYTMPYGSLPLTLTAETGSLSTSEVPDFASFREGGAGAEVVYIADGGKLNEWDGTTLTVDIAATPSVIRRLAVYNRRLFGISGVDQKLYWSGLDAGDTLGDAANGGGEAVIRTFGDRIITGLAPVGGALLIFHISGISVYTGWTQDDINIAAGSAGLTSDVGTTAPRTIVPLENEVLFLSDRGFYSATPEGVTPISVQIDRDVSGLSQTALDASFGVHFRSRREVWFYLSGLGFYVFNYRTRKWSGPLNAGYLSPVSTCAWEAVDSNEIPIVLVGTEGGFVKRAQAPAFYKDDVLSDGTGGTSYTATLQLHRMFAESGFESTKAWRWGYVLFDPQSSESVTIEWDTQYGDDSYALPTVSSSWGSGTWGAGTWGGAGVQPFRIPMSGRGNYVDITIRDAGSSGGGLYSQFSLQAFDLTRRG